MTFYELLLTIGYGALVASSLFAILRERGDPTKALAWILLIMAVPVLGLLLYGMLGFSLRHSKLLSRKKFARSEVIKALLATNKAQLEAYRETIQLPNESLEQIARMIYETNQLPPTLHNQAQPLVDGEAKFAALFDALETAHHHIHVEYYIIHDHKIGRRLQQMLIQKARQGVQVRLMYDGIGSFGLSRWYVRELKEAGAEVFTFLPIRMRIFRQNRINYRNHRKIVVVDGRVGFVGGINVADYYMEGKPKVGKWHDLHLRLEGDAVNWLQMVFLMDWNFVSHQVLDDPAYFPPTTVSTTCVTQIVASGPDSDWQTVQLAYFATISTARQRVYVATPYFIPNESILSALQTAALRGIDVRVLLPGRSDSWLTQHASLSYVEGLLQSGVRVYQYAPGMVHAKLLLVDGALSSIGTANMDIRSFRVNFEINALLYHAPLTRSLEQGFEDDLRQSDEQTLTAWQQRGRWLNLSESLARLVSSLL